MHNYKTKMCEVYERLSQVCVQVGGYLVRKTPQKNLQTPTKSIFNTKMREVYERLSRLRADRWLSIGPAIGIHPA